MLCKDDRKRQWGPHQRKILVDHPGLGAIIVNLDVVLSLLGLTNIVARAEGVNVRHCAASVNLIEHERRERAASEAEPAARVT